MPMWRCVTDLSLYIGHLVLGKLVFVKLHSRCFQVFEISKFARQHKEQRPALLSSSCSTAHSVDVFLNMGIRF